MSEQHVIEPTKKRAVPKTTVNKWITENDKVHNTALWLKYNTDPANRARVASLKCSICSMFSEKLVGMRNYSNAFVDPRT